MFTLPYSTFQLTAFDDNKETFTIRINKDQIDTFCFENPNHEMECDVHIFQNVPPLSYKMFLITYQGVPSFDTKLNSYGFDLLPNNAAME